MWILLTLGCLPTDRFNIVSRVGFMQGTYYCMRLMGGVVCSCVHRRGPVRPSKHTYMTRIPNEVGTSAREIMVRCCATNVYMYRCCGLCCRMLSGRCILYWCARALMRVFRDALRCRTLAPFLVVVFGMGRRCIAHTGRTRLRVYFDGEATFDCCLPCLTHSCIP